NALPPPAPGRTRNPPGPPPLRRLPAQRPVRLLPLVARLDRHHLRHRHHPPVPVELVRLARRQRPLHLAAPPIPHRARPAPPLHRLLGRRPHLRPADRRVPDAVAGARDHLRPREHAPVCPPAPPVAAR